MFSLTATLLRTTFRRVALGLAGIAVALGVAGELCAQTAPTLGWGSPFKTGGSIESSPAIGPDGTIYFGVSYNTSPTTGLVLAIDRDGNRKWQFPASGRLPDGVDSSPTIGSDGTIYVGCWDGKLYALNPDGTKKWETSGGAFVYSTLAIGADGTVYFGGGDGALHAVSPDDGKERWAFPTTDNDYVYSSPAIDANGNIYFGSYDAKSDSQDSKIYAVNSAGVKLWEVATDSSIYASPAIGRDGTVYVGSTDGRLHAIASDGTPKWTYSTNSALLASPVLGADGTIYFGSTDWYFYALTPTGDFKWRTFVGAQVFSTAAVCSDGSIVFGTGNGDHNQGGNEYGRVVALEPDKGDVEWSIPLAYKVPIISSPVIADGSIYVGTMDGMLYKVNAAVRPLSTYSSWPMLHRDATHSGRVPAANTDARLVSLATRAQAGSGKNLIAGFVVQGSVAKTFLIRGVGPTLAQFGVADPLADPTLTLKILGSDAILFANDNWSAADNSAQIAAATAAVQAFPLSPGSKDAALLVSLQPGAYTALIDSADNGSGVALVEAYDVAANTTGARLTGLSTRGLVGTGENVLIPGLVIGGNSSLHVLVRAVGPGLTAFGVAGALARPTLKIYASDQTVIRSNVGWTTDGFKADLAAATLAVHDFAFTDGSADCAVLLTLKSGAYTIQVSGVDDTTGEALVEVYVVP